MPKKIYAIVDLNSAIVYLRQAITELEKVRDSDSTDTDEVLHYIDRALREISSAIANFREKE